MKSSRIMKKEIVLIGTYPPPYGGVSIHIQRLKEQLEIRGMKCIVYDTSGVPKSAKDIFSSTILSSLLRIICSRGKDIIHVHGYDPRQVILFSLVGVLTRRVVIFTIHSFRYNKDNIGLLGKFSLWMAQKTGQHFITVGLELNEKIMDFGIKQANIKTLISFIPPVVRENDFSEIPKEAGEFIRGHSPVISANAYKISFYNNQDLYGIDMCVDLCVNLKKSHPRIGMIFCLPNIGDYDYFKKIQKRIAEKGIEDNFFFQTKPCQFYPILMESDAFVRPTNTDTYGVSIAESLYFKVPAIASDVCLRPEGAILFRSRDIRDFSTKMKELLDNLAEHRDRLANIVQKDDVEKIIDFYDQLLVSKKWDRNKPRNSAGNDTIGCVD